MAPAPLVSPVVHSVEIAASPDAVWRALTDPDTLARWMGGARLDRTWELGRDLALTVDLNHKTYEDRVKALALEPGRLLSYSHWTRISRLPDRPENRSVITFVLDSVGARTRLTVTHESHKGEAVLEHARFFWGVALSVLKRLLER